MPGSLFLRKRRSLRRRLLTLISVVSLFSWAIAGWLSYHQARKEVREMMDAHMAQTASLLLAQAMQLPGQLVELPDLLETLQGVGKRHLGLVLEFQIGRDDGTILTHSARSPKVDLSGRLGFVDLQIEGRGWRSLTVATASGNLRIQMLQSLQQRDKEALEIAAKTVLPLGLLIPFLLGLIYLSVRRGLKPLDDLAQQVSLRSSENLQAFESTNVPDESRPLVVALNRLLSRLGQSLDNERRFTADAAHELRTPLAAIRVQAQVALASTDTDQHRHALNQVVVGTQRATHLVEQLLRLARLDPLAALPVRQDIDLTAAANALFAELADTVPERAGDLHLEVSDVPVVVPGDAGLLAIALRNLIDNALRYTPAGCRITVFAHREHGQPVLGVRDGGPGVKPDDLPKLIERFYRCNDNVADGSGLGLAIVRRIAELHGARFEVDNLDAGGFLARIRWSAKLP